MQVTDSFLLPEMVGRIAAMLNYFLKYLTGPERKGLKVNRGHSLGLRLARASLDKLLLHGMLACAGDCCCMLLHVGICMGVGLPGKTMEHDCTVQECHA